MLYAAEEVQADREVVLAAVSQNGEVWRYAVEDLRADREVVLAAVGQCGIALRDAAEDLFGDQEIVLAAVSQKGYVSRCAAEKLRGDREVLAADGFDQQVRHVGYGIPSALFGAFVTGCAEVVRTLTDDKTAEEGSGGP